MRDTLTPKQQAFVREYLADFNGAQAAIRAGYSPRTARSIAQENLTKPDIQKAIEKATKRAAEQAGLTVDWVVSRLMALAGTDLGQVCEWDEDGSLKVKPTADLSCEQRLALASVRQTVSESGETRRTVLEVKLADKIAPLEMLGRYLGLFKDGALNQINQQNNTIVLPSAEARALLKRLYGGRHGSALPKRP